MLRPTRSLTLFLQQLGRGLRRAPLKSVQPGPSTLGHPERNYGSPQVPRRWRRGT